MKTYEIVQLSPSDLETSARSPKLAGLREQGYTLVHILHVQLGTGPSSMKLAAIMEPPLPATEPEVITLPAVQTEPAADVLAQEKQLQIQRVRRVGTVVVSFLLTFAGVLFGIALSALARQLIGG